MSQASSMPSGSRNANVGAQLKGAQFLQRVKDGDVAVALVDLDVAVWVVGCVVAIAAHAARWPISK